MAGGSFRSRDRMDIPDPVFSSQDEELPAARGVPRWIWAACGLACLALLLVGVSAWRAPALVQEGIFLSGQEARPVAVSAEGYIGSQRCQACHARQYTTWHHSYHRTMTQVASPAAIQGKFEGVLEDQGRSYRLGRDKQHCWVEFSLPGPDPAAPPQTIRRNVALCTGSHHMQVYWLSTGRGTELAIFPFVWLTEDAKWIPREAAFLKPPGHSTGFEPGRWNRTCIDCHTTHGNPGLDPSRAPESTVAEFGIACEACHGPGESHVRYHLASRPSEAVDSIVQPSRLTHERSAEVCGQCHLAWHAEVPGSALIYRPGDELMKLRRVEPKASQFWPDGMVRVVGREFNGLRESPCFLRGTLSCLSCHAMHQAPEDGRSLAEWADDQLQPQMRGNDACLNCHEKYRSPDQLTAHTHHGSVSEGSRCYNCHMPHTTYGLLKATRSHQISNPSVRETVTAGRPNACNLCHLDKTLQWTEQTLEAWYGNSPSQLSRGASEIAMSVQLVLAGDAGQRALIAWHMGWSPAQEASGRDWLAPYLATLLADDYPAVRYMAHRALRRLEGYADISYDSEMPPEQRQLAARAVAARWEAERKVRDLPAVLIAPDGLLQRQKIAELLDRRDHTEVVLDE